MRRLGTAITLLCLGIPTVSHALPGTLTSDGSDDDATISLSVLDSSILGDSRSPCTLGFSDAGSDVVFTDGDTIYLAVWEDDVAGDDLLWETTIDVTSDILEGGAFEGVFDCTTDFGEDGAGGELEIYAQAVVTKAECGTWCLYDRPTTSNLDVTEVIDDGAEDDDVPDDAPRLLPDTTAGRALTDQDYFAVILTDPARIEISVLTVDEHGPVAATLETPEGVRLVEGERGAESIVFTPGPVDAGTYYLRLQPAERPDWAFYDVAYTVDVGTCDGGDTETEDCGACGTRTRACVEGAWESWSACSGEGVCSPGDARLDDCGNCGFREVTCSDACEWAEGDCTGQGECASGDVETEACGDAGTRARECSDECQWDEFSECSESPDPDPECTSDLGGVCESDADCCDGWSCLGPPEEPWFEEGYCASLGCADDDDCGDGICASVFGADTCLAECDDDDDCPPPTLCLEFGDTTACAPPCETDDDCADPDFPTCLSSGACGPAEGGADAGPDAGDVGGDPSADVGDDAGFDRDSGSRGRDGGVTTDPDDGSGGGSKGGCAVASAPVTAPLFGLVLLVGLRRRRP